MIIGALKLTHDGTVALADDDRLIFSAEVEKLNNNKRYAALDSLETVDLCLRRFGYALGDVDAWVVDGWQNDPETEMEPDIVLLDGRKVRVNCYHNALIGQPENRFLTFRDPCLGEYRSYSHIYDHLCSAYGTSPFARRGESAYVLVFDGGTKPVLYFYDRERASFRYCGELLKLGGDVYPGMASRTEAFAYSRRVINGYKTFTQRFAGKVMAYIALGKPDEKIMSACEKAYDDIGEANGIGNRWRENRRFEDMVTASCPGAGDADLLASFHYFLQNKLVDALTDAVGMDGSGCTNLCLAGGSMLNIKWNSAIRRTGLFSEVFAPPFINDAGAAIGALCAELRQRTGDMALSWDAYRGVPLEDKCQTDGWDVTPCSIDELAALLAETGEPVVFLQGRSELGPRALGNRSILADARCSQIKDRLNELKERESYRPVAPIVLEEDAPVYFVPGTRDPFMLFEHEMTERGIREVPGIAHLDLTARVQTVSRADNPTLYELLQAYKRITGVSVLCNTSANGPGRGFFPDVMSAQKWGKASFIWSEGRLYSAKRSNGGN